MGKLIIDIMTPEEKFLHREEADSINFTLEDGMFEILPGHAPITLCTVSGLVEYSVNGEKREIYATEGVAKVSGDHVYFFTSRCAAAEEHLSPDELRHFAMLEKEKESIIQHEESKIAIARALSGLRKKQKKY